MGIALIFSSCNETDIISDEEKIKIEKEIKERLDGYPAAFNRHDIDWFHNFWSNEKGFVFAGDGAVTTNYDSSVTKAYLDGFTQVKTFLHFDWSNGHAYILSRDAVSYATNFDWGLVMASGDTVKSRGAWLYVFQKKSGIWKVVHSAGTHSNYK